MAIAVQFDYQINVTTQSCITFDSPPPSPMMIKIIMQCNTVTVY